MVTSRFKWSLQISKNSITAMMNLRKFAMHNFSSFLDIAAKYLTYALMTQANTENGNLSRKIADDLH